MSDVVQNYQTIEYFMDKALRVPGVRVDRKAFLESNFARECEAEIVKKIIETSPIRANIDRKILNRVANACIKYETYKVTWMSAGTGAGGIYTFPLDITGYFCMVLVIAQKLAYIYGWPELIEDNGNIDDTTKQILLVFVARMYGISGAGKLISEITKSMAEKTAKDIGKMALTKTTWYPILKEILKALGIELTKKKLGEAIVKAVPLVSAAISAGMAYKNFGAGANRLHDTLKGNPFL